MADTEFVRGAERLGQRIATIRSTLALPALTKETGDLLLKRTLQRFDREVDPDERPWAPLKPSTIEIKRRLGYGHKGKLKRTDAMRNAIRIIRGGLGTTFTNTGAGVRIGIESPKIAEYAKAQNQGTDRIVARRFLGVGRLDVKAVDSLLRRKAKEIERG